MTIEGDLGAICSIMKEVSPKLKDIMNAKLSDPKRIMGNYVPRRRGRTQNEGDEPEKEEDDDDNMLDYRILVHESQAGSVIGRGGERIKDLRHKYKMRVIKVYQMLAPMSTDRVVQMVADPENAIECLRSVVEAVESAPPRGRRADYDAMNFSEPDALNYGGWLSKEAAYALQQGMPMGRPSGGMPPMGYMGDPYMGDMGPMPPQGMGPMGMGPPMGRGPMGGGARGPRGRGPMGAGPPPVGGVRSQGPAPVPPPVAQRGTNVPPGGYGGSGSANLGQSYGAPGYDAGDGYGGFYDQTNPAGQSGYAAQGYGASMGGGYGASGYGSGMPRAADMAANMPRGGYGSYGAPGQADDAKVSQWYNEWS